MSITSVILVHVAGEHDGQRQECSRCGFELQAYGDYMACAEGDFLPWFFALGSDVVITPGNPSYRGDPAGLLGFHSAGGVAAFVPCGDAS